MKKKSKSRIKKAGLPPGSLIHIGDEKSHKVDMTIFDYDQDHFEELHCETSDKCVSYKENNHVTWININGVHDVKIIEEIGQKFDLHPLLLEDILNTEHRPKVEDYNDYVFFTLKMLDFDTSKSTILTEQVSLVFGKNYVISFQEQAGDIFDPVRERIRTGKGNIRQKGTDFLVYRLIDTVVDNYFIITEHIGEVIENLEEGIIDNPHEETFKTIQNLKKDLLYLRKSISPLREAVGKIANRSSDLIEEKTTEYFKDVFDHIIELIETIELYRTMLSDLTDMYLSTLSNKMNKVMKVLTIIATIFIPLTFIAGIYGMNFKYMPELEKPWGYPVVMALMFALAIGMVIYFRRNKWW